jgi:2-amino-4-hydroxy-6-hydroxymethyldihydropteridine diphosphokinase
LDEGFLLVIIIAIGSNLPHPEFGSPQAVCEAALQRLEEQGIRIVRRSHWYRSAPVPLSDQPWFINGVAEVDPGPDLIPADLLNRLHEVEASFGRTRSRRNEARILDLDLIDFEGRVTAEGSRPELPHPRAGERAFVLLPLQELAPDWRHPVTGEAIEELIDALPEGQQTQRLE